MKVILVGGNGFIGKNLVYKLRKKNIECCVFDRFIESFPFSNVSIIKGELSDTHILKSIISNGDKVVHLAWNSVPILSGQAMFNDIQQNIFMSAQLFNICKECLAERVIFISSGGTVYGKPKYLPIDELHPMNPNSSYGVTKVCVEKYLSLFTQKSKMRGISLRLSNPYGTWQKPFIGQGVVATYLASAMIERPIEIWGDGFAQRDYVYIDDACDAIIKTLFYEGNESVINIGSNIGNSINDIANSVESISGKKIERIYKEESHVEVNANILDCRLANQELAWSASTSLKEGISNMLNCWDAKECAFQHQIT